MRFRRFSLPSAKKVCYHALEMQGYIYLQTMLFAIVNLALCGAAFCDVVSPLNLLVPRPQVVEVGAGMASEAAQKRIVVVRGPVRGAPESAAAEAYRLDIRADGVTLTAEDSRGKRNAGSPCAVSNPFAQGMESCPHHSGCIGKRSPRRFVYSNIWNRNASSRSSRTFVQLQSRFFNPKNR